jgi:hypothetical protein
MGCQASKSSLHQLDDSIHIMLKIERRQAAKNGKQPLRYRPRDPLPSQMMIPMEVVISEEEQEEVEDSKTPSQMTPMKVIIGEEEQEEVEDSKTVDMFTHTSACMEPSRGKLSIVNGLAAADATDLAAVLFKC